MQALGMLSLGQHLDPDNADATNDKMIEAFKLLLGTRSKVEVEVVISPTDKNGPLGLEDVNLAPMNMHQSTTINI